MAKRTPETAKFCDHEWADGGRQGSICKKCKEFAGDTFSAHGNELTFRFDSKEAAAHFKAYMCDGGGEQGIGLENLSFDYHHGPLIIVTTHGPLDDEE